MKTRGNIGVLAKCGVGVSLALFGLAGVAFGQAKIVKADGSSTVAPLSEAIAEEFKSETKGTINVTVGTSGTGGGFKKFVRGETDISNASRPILAKEMEEAKKNGVEFIELPVCFDALTVVINKKNTFATQMTVEELKTLWSPDAEGKVTMWNQVNPKWPAEKINLFGAGTDSGTFDYFTEAVVGKAKSSRKDYTPSEDDNVLVRGVEGDKNALGYFGMAYYLAHQDKLTAVKIVNKAGKAIAPTAEAVKDGSYQPLSRPLFIYVNKKAAESKPEVRQFVEYFLKNSAKLAAEVKYVPLPAAAYEAALERFKKMDTGTVFGGVPEVGVTIEELMRRETVTEAKPEVKKGG